MAVERRAGAQATGQQASDTDVGMHCEGGGTGLQLLLALCLHKEKVSGVKRRDRRKRFLISSG